MKVKTFVPTDHKVRMLVYGGSGVGKTVFGATAPNPLFFAVENGLLSLADKSVQYVEIKNLQDMRDVLKALQNKTIKDPKGNVVDYDTIVIDSLTEVQQVVINNITGGRSPTQNEWGKFSDSMAEILKGFTKLPKHIIFICLEAEKSAEDEDGREYTRFQPELFGKLAEKAQAMMDFVGRYYMKTEVVNDRPVAKRVLTFSYSPRYRAKDRSGKMPQFANPDFSQLMAEFVKINTGVSTVVASTDTTLILPFPPIPKDKICSKEQQAKIKEAWLQFMKVFRTAEGKEIKPEQYDAFFIKTMQKNCGVDSTTKLRVGQADQFLALILEQIKAFPQEETEEVMPEIGGIMEYNPVDDLKRREELDTLTVSTLKEFLFEAYGVETPLLKKQDIIDQIMAIEMPNAPKKG